MELTRVALLASVEMMPSIIFDDLSRYECHNVMRLFLLSSDALVNIEICMTELS